MFSHFFAFPIVFQLITIYLFIINIITFISFGVDKMKSRNSGARRTPEKTLWLLTLFGGSPAALLSMNYFRHKTKKLSFQAVIVFILIVQITILFALWHFFKIQFPIEL